MRDRLTTKDALVFIALSQRDLMGLYWKIWEPMMMSGAMAFQYLLDWIEHRTGQAALPHPALGQDLTPFMDRGSEAEVYRRTLLSDCDQPRALPSDRL